jgi:glycosyltransferase involved in cell wall biosynthesis
MKSHNTNNPLISIITPVFNGENTIEQTILSVINQTYKNIEYIIIDGGSTDKTIDIIKKYEDKIDYWVSEKDLGLYYAMDKGIRLSNGSIIGNINSDDYYHDEFVFEKVVMLFNEHPEIEVLHGDLKVVDKNNELLKIRKGNHHILNKGMTINHPTVFMKKEVYLNSGGYDLTLKIASDAELMMRLKKINFIFFNCNFVVSVFTKGGISDRYSIQKKEDAYRIYKKYNLPMYKFYFNYKLKPFLLKILK